MAVLMSWTAVKHKLKRVVARMLQVSAYGSEEQSDTGESEAHVDQQRPMWISRACPEACIQLWLWRR